MASKTCSTCGETKDLTAFNFRNKLLNRRWGTCKNCQSRQRRSWYERNKETHKRNARRNKKRAIVISQRFVWDYLSAHPCADCGESDPVVLEFDHVRGKKRMNVTDMSRTGYSIGAIKKEIAKCDVRCANCHRRKTSQERDWYSG